MRGVNSGALLTLDLAFPAAVAVGSASSPNPMPTNFSEVFVVLRDILRRNAGNLIVAEDTASCFRLEGGK